MGIEKSPKGKPWDLVVIGGGPIGLSAAMTASAYDLSVLVLEKGAVCGSEVRAETVSPDPVITKIWGSSFLDSSLVISSQNRLLMHSPGDQKQDEGVMLETPHSFHWEQFIGKMTSILSAKQNVMISLNTAVKKAVLPEKQGGAVESVETSQGTVYGRTFLDCSGHKTVIGRQKGIGLDYSQIVDPIVKARYSGYPYQKDSRFHFFFITAGLIRPQSPPCVVVLFPNAKGEVEVGCQFFSSYGPKGGRTPSDPPYTDEFLMSYYQDIKKNAPGVSTLLSGLTVQIEYLTGMPAKKMISKPMIVPGLALCGDAAGFMDPNTNSGIITGMKSAVYWAEAAKNAAVDRVKWNDKTADGYNDRLKELEFYKNLRASHLRVSMAKSIVYGMWRTADMLNLNWKTVMNMYDMNAKTDAMKVDDDEYIKMEWTEQQSVINAILCGLIVGQLAETKVIRFLGITKKQLDSAAWELFAAGLYYDQIFRKFQGDNDLEALFTLLGPVTRVEYALERNSRFLIEKYVDKASVRAATVSQAGDLLSVMFNQRPLLINGQKKVLQICSVVKSNKPDEEFREMITELGGKSAILGYISNQQVKAEMEMLLG